METSKSTDFKSNVADLTKIPPNEFETYFKEWMERDDVARSLQAKLRCDLIKNFNKTNLGKHILSHTMTSSGGSSLRLTLSPLILALNTLVAEFLYAQNCHFTLSVFCTEIPFRNTLPDFENMRRFRFTKEEICEIWKAVTGTKVNAKDLYKNIIQVYEANPNMSLLLLIIKCLLKKDPLEQLKRNVEIQTEIQEKSHKSISAQVSDRERRSLKDDNLDHINKYLLTLSEKVIEMTKEFEEFAKHRESRPRSAKTSRSREYYKLNKSLERITENMKLMAKTKRKNKHMSNLIELIDHLTQQFGKCAQNFDNVTKVLESAEDKAKTEKPIPVKPKLKEKQTETELQEKSYTDWIHEMRNTENGRKFLNRVDISLRKALTKHREQLQTETDIKIKHLKSLIKLYYQQKFSKSMLRDPKINLEETRKCNDNIEKKLQQFERKQIELFEKLQESSLDFKQNRIQQQENTKEEEKIEETKKYKISFEDAASQVDFENVTKHDDDEVLTIKDAQVSNRDSIATFKLSQNSLRDVSNTQEQILDVAQSIAQQGRSVDRIIFDAKLRIQQLENESNQLEQNFQSYLERRKSSLEQDSSRQKMPKISHELKDLCHITSARLRQERERLAILEKEEDEETDEEFMRLKEALLQNQETTRDKQKSAKSNSSTSSLEIRNAILEAKLKFFEHENTIRKCREKGDEIRTGNLLQKQFEKYSEIQAFPDFFNANFEQFVGDNDMNIETQTSDKDRLEFDLELNLSERNTKEKSVDKEQDKIEDKEQDKAADKEQDLGLSPMSSANSQKLEEKKSATSIKRELFPKVLKQNDKDASGSRDLTKYLRYHEPIKMKGENQTDSSSQLIKQSMARVQRLFEKQTEAQESLNEMVTELQEREREDLAQLKLLPNKALDISLTTTMTSTTLDITNTTKYAKDNEPEMYPNIIESISSLNRISNTSVPSMLNLLTESEETSDLIQHEIEITTVALKETEEKEDELAKDSIQHQEMGEINESFESSELLHQERETNLQQEIGQLIDSPNMSDLNLYSSGNDNEIAEFFTESKQTLAAPIDNKLVEMFSSQSSSEFEISTGHQDKKLKHLGEDSESDFWS